MHLNSSSKYQSVILNNYLEHALPEQVQYLVLDHFNTSLEYFGWNWSVTMSFIVTPVTDKD